jgi:ABC-2 type transport system permease protein
MSIRRVFTLLRKEFATSKQNFIFIFAIVIPVVFSLIISALFGSLFLGQPKLGLVDEGQSRLIAQAQMLEGVGVRIFESDAELREAALTGVIEVGLLLPAGFDELIGSDQTAHITVYVFGESLLRNRAILATTIAALIRDATGVDAPVEITTQLIGDTENIPWEQRLLPFLVLMTVVIGGVMVPATALVEEKQKKTLRALTVSPTTLGEVYASKGLLGVIVGVAMALIILILNGALGNRGPEILLVLSLGATMSAAFGVLLGAFVKDINTLFATIKGIGIFLYAPALVYIFPGIPAWVGKIFPTYYMIQPVVEIAQNGGTLGDALPELIVLVALIGLLILAIGIVSRRVDQFAS